jgi:hypothetical protein
VDADDPDDVDEAAPAVAGAGVEDSDLVSDLLSDVDEVESDDDEEPLRESVR